MDPVAIALAFVVLLIGYLIGSFPSGVVVGRIVGVDVRRVGSGNTGATNVLRAAGLKAAAPVFLVDFLKGLVVVLAARLAFDAPLYEAAAGLGAIFGHNWSAFLRFGGGKGVATSFGVFLALLPLAALVGLATFLVIVGATRYVSLGSVLAAPVASTTALAMVFLGMRPAAESVTALIVASAVLVYRHRENLVRLRAGTERRLGRRVVA